MGLKLEAEHLPDSAPKAFLFLVIKISWKMTILSPNYLFFQYVYEGFYPKTSRPRSKTGLVWIFSPFNKKQIKTDDNNKSLLDDYLARK